MDIMKAILDIEEKAQSIMNTMEDIGSETAKETEQRLAEHEGQGDGDGDADPDAQPRCLGEKAPELRWHKYLVAMPELKALEDDFGKKRGALENAFAAGKASWIKEITDNVKEG